MSLNYVKYKQVTDIRGNKYSRLSVVSYKGRINNRTYWQCKCSCGNTTIVDGTKLKSGHTRSCGCLHIESARIKGLNNTVHGDTASPEYYSWIDLRRRCTNPNNNAFKYYGGRGIKVCARWMNSYENFIADMGRRPTESHTIDRINNDGNYEPSNCRWATKKQQANNKRQRKSKKYGINV